MYIVQAQLTMYVNSNIMLIIMLQLITVIINTLTMYPCINTHTRTACCIKRGTMKFVMIIYLKVDD